MTCGADLSPGDGTGLAKRLDTAAAGSAKAKGEAVAATIVVPLRSQRDGWLEQCLRSALVQTVSTLVVVVVSPHTPPPNLSLIAALGRKSRRLETLHRPPGAGFADAINLGWRHARTDRVGLLLSDDWLAPNAVEQCLAQDADIVCTGHVGYRADGVTPLWTRALDRTTFDSLQTLERKASYLTHFFLFRRSVVLAAGGVDPTIGHVGPDDYDLPWTLLERGASVAFTRSPLYNYRDHDGTRLTLRPQPQQLRDLRCILDKHGVAPDEQARLIDQKARWFGVPWCLAQEDPAWFRTEPEPLAPGPDLDSLISGLSPRAIRVERISDATAGRFGRASFRVTRADGRVLKGRRLATSARARQVAELMQILTGLPLAQMLAHRARAMLEEWIDGVPVDRLARERGSLEPALVEQAGDLLGRLAAAADRLPPERIRVQSPQSMLARLDAHLATLEGAKLLDHLRTGHLHALARSNAPGHLALGPIHQDLAPDNLVLADHGLVLIDAESLEVGPLDFDLARTFYRWPLDRPGRMAFLSGYSRHRNPEDFIRHELYWAIVAVAGGADYRLRSGEPTATLIGALGTLATGELPCPWVRPFSATVGR
jgi:thiamine kinase-like enzyme